MSSTIPINEVGAVIYKQLISYGFENKGNLSYGKIILKRGEQTIIFCLPCRHLRYQGRIIKFHSDGIGIFLKSLKPNG